MTSRCLDHHKSDCSKEELRVSFRTLRKEISHDWRVEQEQGVLIRISQHLNRRLGQRFSQSFNQSPDQRFSQGLSQFSESLPLEPSRSNSTRETDSNNALSASNSISTPPPKIIAVYKAYGDELNLGGLAESLKTEGWNTEGFIAEQSNTGGSITEDFIAEHSNAEGSTKDSTTLLNSTIILCAPRMAHGTLEFYCINKNTQWEKTSFALEQPVEDSTQKVPKQDLAACVVPGLAFDHQGYRLGSGGGYYDQFLEDFDGYKIGVCFREQISRNCLPVEPHDQRMDLIVTKDFCLEFLE